MRPPASNSRDFEARLGKPFAHADRLDELTTLRDQLKLALAAPAPAADAPTSGQSVHELNDRIRALLAAPTDARPSVRMQRAKEIRRSGSEIVEPAL